MLNPICVVFFPSVNTVKHRRWKFVRKCFTAWSLQQLTCHQYEAPPYMFVMIGFYSKCDSESCYTRHYEDISHSQRPEAATRGGLCHCEKRVLRNFTEFTGKHLCASLYWHWCFPVNFAKFLRTPFLQNTPRRLLLNITSFKAFDCVSDLKIPFLVKAKIKLGQMNWWAKLTSNFIIDSLYNFQNKPSLLPQCNENYLSQLQLLRFRLTIFPEVRLFDCEEMWPENPWSGCCE